MRLTPPQAVALAHWTPGVAAYCRHYVGGPSIASISALFRRCLLGGIGKYELTPDGCSALAHLVATESVVIPAGCVRLHHDGEDCGALCWVRSRCRVGMSRLEGGPPPHIVATALTWAPTAEVWATMGQRLRDDYRAGRAGSPW